MKHKDFGKKQKRDTMINYSKLEAMCKTYPNDQHLGSFVRSLYFSEQRAQQSITEGTVVTDLDSQMEEAHKILEENRFPGNTSKDYTISPELQYHSKDEFKDK